MKERVFVVQNTAGIHCRPASVILNSVLQDFPETVFTVVLPDGQETELNSILNLISLGLACGQSAKLSVSGGDEDAALKKIGDMFEFKFDFPNAAKR